MFDSCNFYQSAISTLADNNKMLPWVHFGSIVSGEKKKKE